MKRGKIVTWGLFGLVVYMALGGTALMAQEKTDCCGCDRMAWWRADRFDPHPALAAVGIEIVGDQFQTGSPSARQCHHAAKEVLLIGGP